MRRRLILFSFLLALIALGGIWLATSRKSIVLPASDPEAAVNYGVVYLAPNLTEYVYGLDGPAILVRDPQLAGLGATGLRAGDLLLEIDGAVPDAENWPQLLEKAAAGAELKVVGHRSTVLPFPPELDYPIDDADPEQLQRIALDTESSPDWRLTAALGLSASHPVLFTDLIYQILRRGEKESDVPFLVELALTLDSIGGRWFAMWGAWRLDWRSTGKYLAEKMDSPDSAASAIGLAELAWLVHHGPIEKWLIEQVASPDLIVALFSIGSLADFATAESRQALCRAGADKRGLVRESAAAALAANLQGDDKQAAKLCQERLDGKTLQQFIDQFRNAFERKVFRPEIENLIRNYIRRDKNIVGTFLFAGFDYRREAGLAHLFAQTMELHPRTGYDFFFCGDGLRGPREFNADFTKRPLNLYPVSTTLADGLIDADSETIVGAAADIAAASCLKLIGSSENAALRAVLAARQLAVASAGEAKAAFGALEAEMAIVQNLLDTADITD